MTCVSETIGVIDYRAGNAPSVIAALQALGLEGRLVAGPADMAGVTRIVLPGVGAARTTMESLRDTGLLDMLEAKVRREKMPFMGICVGLQVLFEHSEEGDTACLGWLPGKVVRYSAPSLRVPQIGWNAVAHARPHRLLDQVSDGSHCYFVNSYHAVAGDPQVVIGTGDYGGAFTAMVASGNIVATQFHAEKSGPVGLRMLANFCRMDFREAGAC